MPRGPLRYKKPIVFVPAAQKALGEMPENVRGTFGSALNRARYGDQVPGARPFGEGVPMDVLKLVEDDGGETYRAAFVVAFEGVVYVIDAFQKKSKSGKATPQEDIKRVKLRYQAARRDYEKHEAKYLAAAAAAAAAEAN